MTHEKFEELKELDIQVRQLKAIKENIESNFTMEADLLYNFDIRPYLSHDFNFSKLPVGFNPKFIYLNDFQIKDKSIMKNFLRQLLVDIKSQLEIKETAFNKLLSEN